MPRFLLFVSDTALLIKTAEADSWGELSTANTSALAAKALPFSSCVLLSSTLFCASWIIQTLLWFLIGSSQFKLLTRLRWHQNKLKLRQGSKVYHVPLISLILWQNFTVISQLSVPRSKVSSHRDGAEHKALTKNHSCVMYTVVTVFLYSPRFLIIDKSTHTKKRLEK